MQAAKEEKGREKPGKREVAKLTGGRISSSKMLSMGLQHLQTAEEPSSFLSFGMESLVRELSSLPAHSFLSILPSQLSGQTVWKSTGRAATLHADVY